VVLSHHRLSLPPDLPAGRYTLLAGLYRPTDGNRLPAIGEGGHPLPNDAAQLETIARP